MIDYILRFLWEKSRFMLKILIDKKIDTKIKALIIICHKIYFILKN